jgi:hypothetical protein
MDVFQIVIVVRKSASKEAVRMSRKRPHSARRKLAPVLLEGPPPCGPRTAQRPSLHSRLGAARTSQPTRDPPTSRRGVAGALSTSASSAPSAVQFSTAQVTPPPRASPSTPQPPLPLKEKCPRSFLSVALTPRDQLAPNFTDSFPHRFEKTPITIPQSAAFPNLREFPAGRTSPPAEIHSASPAVTPALPFPRRPRLPAAPE